MPIRAGQGVRAALYVCLCKGLTERDVRQAARAGATTGPVLVARLGLDDPGCCGRCVRTIGRYVELAQDELRELTAQPAS